MGTDIYIRDGLWISTYAGPATDPPTPRRRYQISVINPDTGEREYLRLTRDQWEALTNALIALDD